MKPRLCQKCNQKPPRYRLVEDWLCGDCYRQEVPAEIRRELGQIRAYRSPESPPTGEAGPDADPAPAPKPFALPPETTITDPVTEVATPVPDAPEEVQVEAAERPQLPPQMESPMSEVLVRKTRYEPGACLVEDCGGAEDRRGVCRKHAALLVSRGQLDLFALPPTRGQAKTTLELPPLQLTLAAPVAKKRARRAVALPPRLPAPARPTAPPPTPPAPPPAPPARPTAPPTTPPVTHPIDLGDAELGALARAGLLALQRGEVGGRLGDDGEVDDMEEPREVQDEDLPGPIAEGGDDIEADLTKTFWESEQQILDALCRLFRVRPVRACRLLSAFAERNLEWANLLVVEKVQVRGGPSDFQRRGRLARRF